MKQRLMSGKVWNVSFRAAAQDGWRTNNLKTRRVKLALMAVQGEEDERLAPASKRCTRRGRRSARLDHLLLEVAPFGRRCC